MKRTLLIGEEEMLVEVREQRGTHIRFILNDKEYDFSLTRGPGKVPVLCQTQGDGGEQRWNIAVSMPDKERRRRVAMQGIEVWVAEKRQGGGASQTQHAAADGKYRAPMSGTVTRVVVEPGAQVSTGTLLVVMEAMKMQLEIKAATAGVVKALTAQAGAKVSEGAVLVEIEAKA